MTALGDFVAKTFGANYWTLKDLLDAAPVDLLPPATQYLISKGSTEHVVLISLGKQLRRGEHRFCKAVTGGRQALWVHYPSYAAEHPMP